MVIYAIYIDVYFVENTFIDMLMLWSVVLLMGYKVRVWRIIAASVLGGVGASLILISGIAYGMGYIVFILLLDAAMCILLFGIRKPIMPQVIYFNGFGFAYAKIIGCMNMLGINRFAGFSAAAVLEAAVAVVYYCKSKIHSSRIYDVRIIENGQEMRLKALFDTGNSLTDPYTGNPVSIVEENGSIRGWLEEKPQKYRVIPFRSIGEECGILEGFKVDELVIGCNGDERVEKDAVIALYNGRLSGDGSFQMVLNSAMAPK